MTPTYKFPRSRRFFQLSFDAFRPKGKNKIEQGINLLKDFGFSFFKYLLLKFKLLGMFFSWTFKYFRNVPRRVKSFVVKKLIWSRGKLGRSVALATVMLSALFVFIFGETFNSSPLVMAQTESEDYIKIANDIIPRRETALTEVPAIRKSTESFSYTIQPGDTLFGIGSKFKISVDALKYVNSLTDNSILQVGSAISIPPVSGLVHKVEKGDTLTSIAEKYDVPVQAVADFNYILDTSKLALGTELVIPGAKVPEPVKPYIPPTVAVAPTFGSGEAIPSRNFCVWPTTVRLISQYFTWYHNGVDITTPSGSPMPPLFSCRDGVIVRAGWDPFGLGLHVRIDHGDGYETVYGHMSSLNVKYGEKVSRGQIIGWMGNTGNSTGPHVHFMVKYNGVPQNPQNYTN
ncbi:peptidoglycan DD-metalloendopeptidase family protein [Patescibacteria group bacterium]|nr:peptidoglycan DD-metalloendopeptidase family protein [Patescibacteria group bacterium]